MRLSTWVSSINNLDHLLELVIETATQMMNAKASSLMLLDVGKDTRWYREISNSIGFQTHSIACVPMKVEEKIIGVVELIDKTDESPFTDNDMNIYPALYQNMSSTVFNPYFS